MVNSKPRHIGRSHGYVMETKFFGDLLKSARIAARMSTREDLVDAVREQYKLEISADVIGKYERGETVPSFEMVLLLMAVLQPRGGFHYFRPCAREDIAKVVF